MLARFLIGIVRLYRYLGSGLKPVASCRFSPTCSAYAIEALERHGTLRGGGLAIRRILRCHPWGAFGVDPVPPSSHSSCSTQAPL
jgi:putative membrane protein insertion efficiency factor